MTTTQSSPAFSYQPFDHTTGSDIAVSLSQVSYTYSGFNESLTPSDVPASITDVSFTVRPGEITLLCGPSGSGKSTVIRTINGLATGFHDGHLDGDVIVQGANMSAVELQDVCRLSATVFQNPRTQFFTTDVRSEMALPLENLGVEPDLIRTRIADVARASGIEWALDRSLSSLSGGQLQRVACSCAYCMDVPVLLFDEPTSNLDQASIDEFAALLGTLKQSGAAIIVAEHRLHFLAGLADTVHRMKDGHLVETLSATDFFSLSDDDRRARGLRALEIPETVLPQPEGQGLEIADIRFSYGDIHVLDIDHAVFPAGAVTVLSGPNGAGKTTLARILCGLAEPDSGGTITLDGRKISARRRNSTCAIVMQDVRRQLFAESVRDEVRLGQEKLCDEATADELLARLDLTVCAEAHPLAISGGQQQRLVIASALASRRRVVIFDEPTSGVDYGQLTRIARLIKELAATGTIVIVITHDREFIAECGDFEIMLPKLHASSVSKG